MEQAAMYAGMAAQTQRGGSDPTDILAKALWHWETADSAFRQLPKRRREVGGLHIERDRVRKLIDGACDV